MGGESVAADARTADGARPSADIPSAADARPSAGARPSAEAPRPAERPPVTAQETWETQLRPWLEQVEAALGAPRAEHPAAIGEEVDRLHRMTGAVARDVQRSMAPISTYLVGLAVGRGASLEEACRTVEALTRR